MNSSWKLLEFDIVLNKLKDRIKTETGLFAFNQLNPRIGPVQNRLELETVRQATDFIRQAGNLSFDYLQNIEPFIANLKMEGYVLSIEEMLEIAKLIEIFRNNRSMILPYSDEFSCFFNIISSIKVPEQLLNRFAKVFDSDGNIKDSASPDLKKIRNRKNNMKNNLQKTLNKIMDSDDLKDAIQDRIVTVRDNRFVIPVKVSYKNRAASIVHSISKSGNTAFVEPAQVVSLNNEMIDIDEKEKQEIYRILKDLSDQVREQSTVLLEMHTQMGYLESVHVRAQFAKKYHCYFPEISDQPGVIRLRDARHPLLIDEENVVPIDVELGFRYEGIIISGPNAGGKTVALKTIGLLCLMASSGLPIPSGDNSLIGQFNHVLTEIGDDQSITDHLSSFSGHILNLSRILHTADHSSLVLIDEIASSTEPKEGEAIGREIILELIKKKTRFIITTHFQGIKNIATEISTVRNAYVEFDLERLEPLYRLHIGAAGKSYALSIAGRYGLEKSLIHRASSYLESQKTHNERLIDEIEDEKNRLMQSKKLVENHLQQAREIKNIYKKRMEQFEEYKRELEKKGVSQLKRELDSALKEITRLKKEIKNDNKNALKTADKIADKTRKVIDKSEQEILEIERKRPSTLFPGQKVYIRSFNKTGTIEEIKNDKVKIRIGIISSVVDKYELFIDESDEQSAKKASYTFSTSGNSAKYEYVLNLVGERTEDAIKRLEKNLDLAVIQGHQEMIIIHGKGKGILRSMIHDFLKNHPHVEKYYHPRPQEGGEGKTIIVLNN